MTARAQLNTVCEQIGMKLGMLIDHFQPAGLLPATIFFVFWWPVFAGKVPATVAGALEIFSSIYSHYLPATVAGFNTFFLRALNHVPATCRPRWPALHKILRIEIDRIQFRYSDQFLLNCSVSACVQR